MIATIPSLYKPSCPDEFIGPARIIARELERAVLRSRAADFAPIKFLLNGPPGSGKTSLSNWVISQLLNCTSKWSYQKFSGTKIKLELCDEIEARLAYTNLYGDYNVIQIEETDKIPPLAQVRFLMLMDDIPPKTAIIATSNCQEDQFEKRFQSRFKMYEVDSPSQLEIKTWLERVWSVPAATAMSISAGTAGDVRAALLDAERALDAIPIAA